MFTIDAWYGRLGNNIQQCANGLLAARLSGASFHSPPHPLIGEIRECFGDNPLAIANRWFYWQNIGRSSALRDFAVPWSILRDQLGPICRQYIGPRLRLPESKPIPAHTLVIHLRGGDLFDPAAQRHDITADIWSGIYYVQNPLSYYLHLLEGYERALVVSEPGSRNPVLPVLAAHPKVSVQSGSLEEDFATLVHATSLASSGVGTFAVAAALCSSRIRRFHCSPLALASTLHPLMLRANGVSIEEIPLPGYIRKGEWRASPEQLRLMMDYQLPSA